MTTAYEFQNREERRIRMPVYSAITALVVSILVFAVLTGMKVTASNLETEYADAAVRMEKDAQAFINRASSMLPQETTISEIERQVARHNLKIGGKFSAWSHLFNALDTAMPEDAIFTAIENPFTSKSVFAAEDRFFRFRIAVKNTEQANAFYMKLSESKVFENLNFSPRGEIKLQGQTGFGIDIEFKFNESFR